MQTFFATILLCCAIFTLSGVTRAAELVTNGGFETGNFSGWTVINNAGGWKNWQIGVTGQTTNDGSYVPVPTTITVQQGTRVAYNGVTGSAGSPYLLYQDITIPVGFYVRMTWIDRYQMNHTQFCSTTCGTATYAVEILTTSNVLLQTLYVVNTPTNTNTNTGYVGHLVDLTAYQGQTIRIRFRASVTVTLAGPGQLEVDAVSVQTLQPTAAGVTVEGQVTSFDGLPLPGVTLTIADAAGVARTALSGPFGYYRFEDLESGGTYILSADSKRYVFPDSPRVLNLSDSVRDINFMGNPTGLIENRGKETGP